MLNSKKVNGFGLSEKNNYYLIGLGIAAVVSTVLMVVFALLMTFVDLSDGIVTLLGVVSLSTGALLGSYYVGTKIKKGGLLLGIINGFIIVILNFVLGIILKGLDFTPMFFVKILSVIISSLVGGVYAVNKVAKRRI